MLRWLVIFTLAMSCLAQGQVYRRLVNFEWEPIDGAKYYEIEIRKKEKNAKSNAFTTPSPAWNGRLQIGRYEFRLRALDKRKVPGEWSAYADLDVGLEPVKIEAPAAEVALKSNGDVKHEVEFKWHPTPEATGYIAEIYNSQGEKITEEKTSKTSFTYELPVASVYTWKIKALSNDGLESEFGDIFNFTIVGAKLGKTKIEKPENEFVREIKWEKVENAENYDVILARYNPTIKKWQKFKAFENVAETSLNFESDWPGGRYRAIIKSKAAIRQHSDLSSMSFLVHNGNRSPAAEYTHTLRKSIDRFNGWFTHASWYASSISMSSEYKSVLGLKTNAITGTGRLGLGWIKPDSEWGFMGVVEAAGYVFENRVYNFLGLELSAIRKKNITERSDVRYQLGLYSKEFPALWTTSESANANYLNSAPVDLSYSKGGIIGPHFGVEYWYSMTPKFGLQANSHLYFPIMGQEFPNGGKVKGGADLNYAIGAMGSYRYSSKLTGLVGFNYRQESYSYTDSSNQVGWSSGVYTGKHTSNVKTTVSGIYINFMAEYSF